MGEEFNLVPLETQLTRRGGARPGAGRPKGRQNKLSEINWKMAAKDWPEIRAGLLKHARRLNEPNHTPTKIELECAVFVAERMWREPRGAPVQIDINAGRGSLLDALAAGELTPADTAALLRALDDDGRGRAGPLPLAADALQLLQDRVRRVLEERDKRAAALPITGDLANVPGASEAAKMEMLERRLAEVEAAVEAELEAAVDDDD